MTIKLTKEQKIKANRKARRDADIFFNLTSVTKTNIYKNKKLYSRKDNKKIDI